MKTNARCEENGSILYMAYRAICYSISFFLIFFAFIIALVFIPWRILIGFYLSKKYKQKIEFLDGLHALYSIDNDSARMHLQICQVFSGKIDIDQLRDRVKERWLRKEDNLKFRRILKEELGYFFWLQNPNLQLENHVLQYRGSEIRTMTEMNAVTSELAASLPVKKDIFWQIHVLDLPDNFQGYENGPKCMLFANFHHSLGDGVTLPKHLADLSDNLSNNSYLPPKPSLPYTNPIKYFLKLLIEGPFSILKHAVVRERHQLLGPHLSGVKLISISDQIPLDKLEKVANYNRTNLDSILTSCVVGGLRSYFLSERLTLPSLMRFIRPVNLPGTPIYKKNKLVVKAAFVCYELPLNGTTPLDRLNLTTEMTEEWDNNPSTYLSYLYAMCCINRSPSFLTRAAVTAMQTSGVIAHINTGHDDSVLFGNNLIQIFGIASSTGISGIALTSVISNGSVTFGLKVDTAIIRDQGRANKLIGFIISELYDLERDSEKLK